MRVRKALLHDASNVYDLVNSLSSDGTLLKRPFAEVCENIRDFTVAESDAGVFLGCGALFIVHVLIDPSGQGAHWHLAMGILLIAGGLIDLVRVHRHRPSLIPLAVLPLAAFALALIAIPVAAAS